MAVSGAAGFIGSAVVRALLARGADVVALVEPEGDLNPLFVVAGATGGAFHPRLVSTSQMWGAFGLTILEFDPLETVAEPR